MNHIINVSVANIYRKPSYQSELINQAILGEQVELISKESYFVFIRLENGCEGWISQYQVCKMQSNDLTKVNVVSHLIQIFEKPDSNTHPVRDAVIGCQLNLVNENNDWYQLQLPDGTLCWSQKKHFGEFPLFSTENVGEFAKQFLGYPYFWGGRSPKGFDCSGLTYTTSSLLGQNIRRNSWMQFKDSKFVSTNPFDARKGDFIFFGDDKNIVDHVGIALGDGKIIHARGRVRINSFKEDQPDFDKVLKDTLIAVASVF